MFRYTRGSSPLTRGKRGGRRKGRNVRRLIPAHAGKTCSWPDRSLRKTAHPRSRGENGSSSRVVKRVAGSSPLTRGKLGLNLTLTGCLRLIPAHAGKTKKYRRLCGLKSAHPRSRGENLGKRVRGIDCSGSSPLTRGKLLMVAGFILWGRLIPAHAGKTCSWPGRSPRRTAHPRSRGENKPSGALANIAYGSSPLTRGKPLSGRRRVPPRRLIPAHAGKTRRHRNGRGHREAHPRSRGENDSGGETRP